MLMLASGNLLKPSDGAPVTVPTQDMILGSYYLTTVRENEEGAGKIFRDENEALMAYAEHVVTLHAPIKVRRTMVIDGVERTGLVDATVGRIIFNNPVPQNLGYIDRTDRSTGWSMSQLPRDQKDPARHHFPLHDPQWHPCLRKDAGLHQGSGL